MAGDNRLVTENFLRLNFTPRSGVTSGTNDLISLDCDQVLARYNVTVSGVTTTGKRCPGQNQISGLEAPTIVASNVTRTNVEIDLRWFSYPEFLTAIGYVRFRHPNGLITDIPDADEIVSLNPQPIDTYYLRTGGYFVFGQLLPNTTYYTRAVYQTSTGTYYGPEISFTTLP